ncbi:unnamed protein product [Linum tenue]|uniref:Uncharacterized protein n=1 Tax=Linum tenue TaxID=586396 RepID=A0AAV0JJV0_9ROSI|nr:unnamed protein product [Linum tenue]
MSVERSFEAWEEVQRQGHDLADRLAQGFTGLIQTHMTNPPAIPWANTPKSNIFDLEFPGHSFISKSMDLGVLADNRNSGIAGVSAILDIGNKIGQAGAEFGAGLNGLVEQFFRRLPVPFKHNESMEVGVRIESRRSDVNLSVEGQLDLVNTKLKEFGFVENEGRYISTAAGEAEGGTSDGELGTFDLKSIGLMGGSKPQGTLNFTSTYESRTGNVESSMVARGDLWRMEASHDSSTSGNENSSLFLVQLGPVLFVRDSTLLLPVHLSKQHLLWYGYDRKNGMHSLCPAVWSKHRRWLLMSMLCLKPLACSFVDLQFPNGQLTYISGEGLTTSAFLPAFGGLLQAQGQYPGEMRFSFSHKNKWGTRITPAIQWPDKSFSLGFSQNLAWQRSGLMMKPTVQFSLCPSFGGSNPGLRAELQHSLNEQLNLICGCAFVQQPSVFASVSIGRSKWNGNIGSSGIVLKLESPLSGVSRPAFSVQINSAVEF